MEVLDFCIWKSNFLIIEALDFSKETEISCEYPYLLMLQIFNEHEFKDGMKRINLSVHITCIHYLHFCVALGQLESIQTQKKKRQPMPRIQHMRKQMNLNRLTKIEQIEQK